MMKRIICLVAMIACGVSGSSHAGFLSDYFSYTKTKHPIMLVPGIFAFDTIAFVDYWYQIPSAIEYRGGEVYVAKINAFDSSVKRGEALIAQLENIRAASGGRVVKFNLMGHSQGGMTSRYVMEVRPDLVASVTTMATPHTGSPVADLVNDVAPPKTVQGTLLDVFFNALGDLVNLMSDNRESKADVAAMLGEFTQAGASQFNTTFPHGLPATECGSGPSQVTVSGHNIKVYSWGGVGHFTGIGDISDALLAVTGLAFDTGVGNDGITGQCANHFGTVIRDDYFMNHLDINNHIFGLTSLFETNPKSLYKTHANRLKKSGL